MSDEVLIPQPVGTVFHTRSGRRDAEAMRLRALGWSLKEICEKLELGDDERRAAAAIKRAMANMARFANEEHRLLELQGLDDLENAAWHELRRMHIMVSNGRIIRDDDNQPLNDDRFALDVIDRILKIKERRAKLLGLDAPTRSEVISIDSVDNEIAKLEAELKRSLEQQ